MCISASPCPPLPCSKNLDVDEVTVDANANWTAVEKPMDSKDDEGMPRDKLEYSVISDICYTV